MKYKKTIILLALVVFLLSIAGVSASEIGDTIASENANTIELSTDNDIIEDNLQTSEENEALASTDYDEAIAQTDTEVLGADSVTYSDLAEEIRHSGNITLTHKNYTYDKDATAITISEANKVIDGNGAVIDMNESTIRAFTVYASGVTIKNLTIKNANYDGDGGAIYFDSSATSGTVTNCNFTNNKATGDGGAVYFFNTGNVTNCNFTDNTATLGGAVYFLYTGTVTNCNFTNNTATDTLSNGGAVYFDWTGTVTNCNFTDNKATQHGGAVYFLNQGTVSNCNFADNSASRGGAILSVPYLGVTVDTCIFKTDSDTTFNTRNLPPTLNVDNFTTVHGSGEKLTFDLKTNSSIPVTNGNISISVYFKDNGVWVRNYTCLSGEGWIPDLPVGSYIAFFDTEYAEFQEINRTITITAPEHTFWFLNYTINGNDNPVIELSHDFYFDPAYDAAFVNGIVINRPVTIKGNGNAIDAKRQSRIFYVQSANAVLENLTLKNANYDGDGGAIYFSSSGTVTNCNFNDNEANYGGAIFFANNTCNVTNCNFTNNTATSQGGAVCFVKDGEVTNCNFNDNEANYGGAVCFVKDGEVTNCNFADNKATGDYSYGGAIFFMNTATVTNCSFVDNTANYEGGAVCFVNTATVTNCNFTGNNATNGSAIYFHSTSATKTVSNSRFLNNRANAEALEITKNDNNITITFTGRNNLLNAIYSINGAEVTFTNVTYWGVKGITTVSATMSGSNKATGQNITVGVVVNNEIVLSDVIITNENGTIVLDISAGENYYISARHVTDSYYTEAERTISNNINVNVTSQTTINKTVNITAKSNIFSEVMPGKLLFILPNGTQIEATYGANGTWWAEHTFDAYGEYNVNATYVGLDNVAVNDGTITINKVNSTITLDNIVLDYGESTNVTVTTTGATGITAKIDGNDVTVINNYNIQISGLKAGNHTLTVTTIPDDDHNPVTATSKITVNKVESTLTVDDIVFDYGSEGSGNVSFAGASEVIANVVSQPSAVVSVNGKKITVSGLATGTYTLNVTTVPDENHTAVTETATITVNKVNSSLTLDDVELDYGESINVTVSCEGATGIDAKIDGVNVAVDDYTISISDLSAGNHTLTVATVPDENHTAVTKTATITVNKISTNLTAAGVTATYKVNKYLIIKLTDGQGNPLANSTVTVDLNGAKNYTTDENGQIKIKVSNMVPKTYSAKISYAGNDTYIGSNVTAKVVVKKATPKITASAKTFKTATKTKKYTITLKDNTGKAIKNAKVTLKVNGKTYKATTNSKGKATFKITKLTKKGTFKATITYTGNKYYNKVTKKANIKVISSWKTISKGSKDKSTVREIQQALKNHGYYLTAYGHYLMVDGKFQSCTERSVKEFQHDKGLKVTGKVDEKTAKKLGLI